MLARSPARSIVSLRALAFAKGFELQRSTMRDCWRLIGPGGVPAKAPGGGTGFTVSEARQFLTGRDDR